MGSSDTPLVTPQQVSERVSRLESAADAFGSTDELLSAMLVNQQHFYNLWREILAEQGGGGQIQSELQSELSRLNEAIMSLAGEEVPTQDRRTFRINRFDVFKRDWVLSDEGEGFTGPAPDVSGADEVAIFVESDDDAAFEILVRFVDEEGNTRAEVDSNVDSELASTSPGGTNHHIFVTVALADNLVDIVVRDTSSGQNRVTGNMNFH